MERLDGKVALVTGASRGIGKAIALAYARAGARVVICARHEQDLRRTADEIASNGGAVRWEVMDIRNARNSQRLVRSALRSYGRLDVVVNNASLLGPRVPIIQYPLTSWEAVLRTNLTAAFVVCKEAAKNMMLRREGSIINISSGVGRIGRARWGAYAVSKFGVEALTQVLAEELKDTLIRINAVNPGATRTEMRAQAYPDEDPQTLPRPEDITGIFLYLASDRSREVTGKSFDAREWPRNAR